jgi:hypothetical protein
LELASKAVTLEMTEPARKAVKMKDGIVICNERGFAVYKRTARTEREHCGEWLTDRIADLRRAGGLDTGL